MERQAGALGGFARVGMVGDDGDDIDRQRPDMAAIEQILKAMVELRHHQDQPGAPGRVVQRPLHREGVGDGGELRLDTGGRDAGGRLEADAHEEEAGARVAILGALDDVALGHVDGGADARDDAATIGA